MKLMFDMGSGQQDAQHETAAKLLDAAGELFAAKGFEAVTVRAICSRASVNIASVNYHFGDKEGLYKAVVRSIVSFAEEAARDARGGRPEQQLREFISGYLHGLLGDGRPSWKFRIMQREMADPTPALKHIVRTVVAPAEMRLREIIGGIAGRDPFDESVRLCAHSVIGQCLHYKHAEPIFRHLWPDLWADPNRLDRLVDHIVEFSTRALKEMKRSKK